MKLTMSDFGDFIHLTFDMDGFVMMDSRISDSFLKELMPKGSSFLPSGATVLSSVSTLVPILSDFPRQLLNVNIKI